MIKLLTDIPPASLLRVQVVAVAASALVAVVAFLFGLSLVRGELQDSSSKTSAALQSFKVHDELSRTLSVLRTGAETSIEDRPPAERPVLRQALLGLTPANVRLDFEVPLSLKEAAVLQATYDLLLVDVGALAAESDEPGASTLLAEIESLQTPINAYLSDPSGRNFHQLFVAVSVVENHARSAIPNLITAANDDQEGLSSTVRSAGFAALAVLIGFAGILVFFTATLSKRVHEVYTEAESERQGLRETTNVLLHRNEQMAALYSVFTEITETLSLRYVVNATLRESLKLMNCHTAVLRLVKDRHLEVIGSLSSDGSPVTDTGPKALGEGTAGQVAKRGRSLRIGEANQELLSDLQRRDGQRSGMIIPLIIGARVVGTLSVWSREPDAFSEEDERILGMMGSQVATAVVAADTHEASEHRAHHDPLTGLPNRLQLAEDIASEYSPERLEGREAVVAMVDIDHFKRFNDDFGHAVGDVSLQQVASTMRNAVREHDRVYRYGGEEFLIVFMDTTPEVSVSVAERVRAAVESTPLSGDRLEPVGPVTISMGLAKFPEDGAEFGKLIELADIAMYRAKARGRNQIVAWGNDVILLAEPAA